MSDKIILVANDDGIDSEGIKQLALHLAPLGKVIIVAPTVQRSGESKSITFSRPLRVSKIDKFPFPAYSVDGTPADSVIIGKHLAKKEFGREPDLVVSGINSGDNTSVHALLTSGTCAAAFESALIGIPAIAFSKEVKSEEIFFASGSETSDYIPSAKRSAEIVKFVLENPLPQDIRFLNVNFPSTTDENTPIEIVNLAPEKYINDVIEQQDPRNTTIYWIWGDAAENLKPNTDAYVLTNKRHIAMTPISLGFGRWAVTPLKEYFKFD